MFAISKFAGCKDMKYGLFKSEWPNAALTAKGVLTFRTGSLAWFTSSRILGHVMVRSFGAMTDTGIPFDQ